MSKKKKSQKKRSKPNKKPNLALNHNSEHPTPQIDEIPKAENILVEDQCSCQNLLKLAQGYEESAQLPAALDVLQKALYLEPENPQVLNNLGIVCCKLGQHQEALKYFAKLMQISPEEPSVYNNLGFIHSLVGKYEAAEELFQKAIKLKADYFEALNNLAKVYHQLARFEEALQIHEQCLQILDKANNQNKPLKASIHFDKGCLLAGLFKYSEAEKEFRLAIQLEPLLQEKVEKFQAQVQGGDYLERNCKILSKKYPQLAFQLLKFKAEPHELITSKSGPPTAKVKSQDGQMILLHSEEDPVQEAKDFIATCEKENVSHYVILGFGLGYHIEELIKQSSPQALFLIIEPHLTAFKLALRLRDLENILKSERIVFLLGNQEKDLLEVWHKFFNVVTASKLVVIQLPNYEKICGTYFKRIREKLSKELVNVSSNLQTLMKEGLAYQLHTLKNLPYILKHVPVKTLFNSFQNVPAIIIAAGPSLDKNVDLLKNIEDKALLISVETALKPLLKRGINPHFVLTADPSLNNYRHLQGAPITEKTYLIAEPMVAPETFQNYPQKIFIASFGDRMMSYLSGILGEFGKLQAWGSISTMAFDFAQQLGANPIILIGQDLAFTKDKIYCRGTYQEEAWLKDLSRFYTLEMKNRELLQSKDLHQVKDFYGNDTFIEKPLYSYYTWFAERLQKASQQVINATEGGILKNGVEWIDLKTALATHCQENHYLGNRIKEIYASNLTQDPNNWLSLKQSFQTVQENFKLVMELSERGIKRAQRISKEASQTRNPQKIQQLWLQTGSDLKAIREQIKAQNLVLPFIELANQRALFDFQRNIKSLKGSSLSSELVKKATQYYAEFFSSLKNSCKTLSNAFAEAEKEIDKLIL